MAAVSSATVAMLFLMFGAPGTLGLPFIGVPVVRVAHRNSLGAGLAATGLAALLLVAVTLLDGGSRAATSPLLLMGLVAGLPAFFSGLVRGGADPSREYFALAISGCVLVGGILMLPPALGARPMDVEVAAAFDAMIPGAMASYSKANVDSEMVARVRATLEAARDFSRRYWLGLVGAFWIMGSAVTFYTGARSARPAASAEKTRFESFSLPALLAPVFVVAGAVFALSTGTARQAAGDVLIPLTALYFVAGMSIICHFARKWFRLKVLRVGLYALVVYFPMNVGVALLGLFDWYAHFRRRGEKE